MMSIRVDLQQGSVFGSLREGVQEFLAIPYGTCERWKAPVEVVHKAQEAVKCPQVGVEGHEDCLQLNLWVAEGVEKAPCLVYIHGGGGKCHSAHGKHESGHALAQRGGLQKPKKSFFSPIFRHNLSQFVYFILLLGLCCVNINYRLGLFGFLAHRLLSEEDPEASGSYALLDQIFALQWLQRNVKHFGGDAENVTIWGLSSGAQYVCNLLVMPRAKGLFHRAVVQSCTDLNNVRQLRGTSKVWEKSAEEMGESLCQEQLKGRYRATS